MWTDDPLFLPQQDDSRVITIDRELFWNLIHAIEWAQDYLGGGSPPERHCRKFAQETVKRALMGNDNGKR